MIQNTCWIKFGRTFRNALVCASLMLGLTSTTLQAAANGNGLGLGNGNGNGNGVGLGRGNGNGNGHGLGNATVSALNIVPTITSLTVSNGQLLASGVVSAIVNGSPVFEGFTGVPVTLAVTPQAGACPILNLQLAPIHLNLLGLVLDTSSICVDITANSGAGLLGNLLCSVANALNGGTNLNQILTNLVAADLQNLLLGLTAILNGALANLSTAIVSSITAAGDCSLLNLTLGPINLNILGLVVAVDNCTGGPVTVSLTGQPGPGALLGNLTCGLLGGGGILGGTTLAGVINQLLGLL